MMFITNFKIAYRNLIRNKIYSFINIAGLAIGMACTILLLLFVKRELGFDRFHKDIDQIYQVANWQRFNGTERAIPNLPGALIDQLKDKYPEIEYAANCCPWGHKKLISYKDFKQYGKVKSADPDFLKILSFPLLQGNINTCLNDPYSIVISEKIAQQIFKGENPIGKLIRINNSDDFQVTGVVKNSPSNSSIQIDYLVPFEITKKEYSFLNEWGNYAFYGLAKIKKGVDPVQLNQKLESFYKENVSEQIDDSVFLSPYADQYLYHLDGSAFRITKIRLFFAIALFILIIACFNFMNLSTARATKRAKEIGLKKVVGSNYLQLINQFLGESLLISIIACNFAILLCNLCLPYLNNILYSNLYLDYSSPDLWIIILSITIITGIFAGIYPAFYISGFPTLSTLKGVFNSGKKSKRFRKYLVIFQFTIASVLSITCLTFIHQTKFLANMDIGLNKDNIICVKLNHQMLPKIESLKEELQAKTAIKNISYSRQFPYNVRSSGHGEKWQGKAPDFEPMIIYPEVDANFIETFEIPLLEGRFFNKYNSMADSNCIVINQLFAQMISKESVIGKIITKQRTDLKIIGVIKNYHCTPNTGVLEPVMIRLTNMPKYLYIRYNNKADAIDEIEKICSKYSPDFPVVHFFLNDQYNHLFKENYAIVQLLTFASVLAILIASLGIFGLISFTAEERTKEIGIRKVLGASIFELVLSLSIDFGKSILMASLISFPISYYIVSRYLENYAYHISFPYYFFLLVLLLLLLSSMLTIACQSWKSATKNPIESLKYE